jgi:hypothetical protein
MIYLFILGIILLVISGCSLVILFCALYEHQFKVVAICCLIAIIFSIFGVLLIVKSNEIAQSEMYKTLELKNYRTVKTIITGINKDSINTQFLDFILINDVSKDVKVKDLYLDKVVTISYIERNHYGACQYVIVSIK